MKRIVQNMSRVRVSGLLLATDVKASLSAAMRVDIRHPVPSAAVWSPDDKVSREGNCISSPPWLLPYV